MQCRVFVCNIHITYLRKHKNTTYRIEDSQCRHCRQDSQFSEVIVSITVYQAICLNVRPKFSSHSNLFLLLTMFVAALSSQLNDIVYDYVCSLLIIADAIVICCQKSPLSNQRIVN